MTDPPDRDESHVSADPTSRSDVHGPQPTPEAMTTPTVVEMPRRLEPTSRDTFLGSGESVPLTPGVVVPLHSRTAPGTPRRPRRRRGATPPPRPGSGGPGGDAA
jgi:hypothetical protein